jgi:hypothetical protein
LVETEKQKEDKKVEKEEELMEKERPFIDLR